MKKVELDHKEQMLILSCLIDLKVDIENNENFRVEEIKEVEDLINKIRS